MRPQSSFRIQSVAPVLFAAAVSFADWAPASAHPHILAEVTSSVSSQPGLTQLQFKWSYDPAFTAFMMQEAKITAFDEATLAGLAQSQSRSLGEYGFFTKLTINGSQIDPKASEARMTQDASGALSLSFVIQARNQEPLKQAEIEIFDPNFFAYFSMSPNAVTFSGQMAGCRTEIESPGRINLKDTRSVPKAFWAALDGKADAAQQFVNRVRISCPDI